MDTHENLRNACTSQVFVRTCSANKTSRHAMSMFSGNMLTEDERECHDNKHIPKETLSMST
jgi:hypothetical protein